MKELWKELLFLSRLYDGERIECHLSYPTSFLSRLYDGELLLIKQY